MAICEVCCSVNRLRFLGKYCQGASFIWNAKEAIALFSIQFEGEKIKIKEIKSPCLLAASFNVLITDKGTLYFEKSFVKNLSSSLKSFTHFATRLQNTLKNIAISKK